MSLRPPKYTRTDTPCPDTTPFRPADLDLGAVLADRAFAALCDPGEFAKVEVGDWGHSLAWPSGAELGADMLWLETLSATGHGDVRAFLEWRLRHALDRKSTRLNSQH